MLCRLHRQTRPLAGLEHSLAEWLTATNTNGSLYVHSESSPVFIRPPRWNLRWGNGMTAVRQREEQPWSGWSRSGRCQLSRWGPHQRRSRTKAFWKAQWREIVLNFTSRPVKSLWRPKYHAVFQQWQTQTLSFQQSSAKSIFKRTSGGKVTWRPTNKGKHLIC